MRGLCVDGHTLRRVLKRTSIGMQPEGIAGVFHGARPAREAVFLQQRKGFIRLAIQAGTGMSYQLKAATELKLRAFGWLKV